MLIKLEDLSREKIITKFRKVEKELEKVKNEKEKLERELKKYKNSNTPSSQNKHLKFNTFGLQKKEGVKPGAKKGHKGKTRMSKPTSFEVVDCKECPNCHSLNLKDQKVIRRTMEEIPTPVLPEVKEFEIHVKKCNDCKTEFIPSQNTTPIKGKFGINIIVLVIFLKFLLRGVLRKTASFLDAGFMFRITPASVNAILKRAAKAANGEYDELKERIRKSKIVYVDETSFSVLGKNQWVWVFKTANDILLVIRPSRGNNVLEEILGIGYSGTVICDCWRAYNYLENAHLQRCWAHLLRKSKVLTEYVAGAHFHKKLQSLFREIKIFNSSSRTSEERVVKYREMTSKLRKIMEHYAEYEEFNSTANYINFNLENWFTCIKYEGVEPTNNFAEQAIRETVIVRKIIGAFRSEEGKENYSTLASLIATWQLQNLDLKKELKRMLTKNLCFC